ncbi:MAG: ABC transporter permease subunit [Pseudomonadota bacterium]
MSGGAGTPQKLGRALAVFVPYAWLLVLFLIPFLLVFKISLSEVALKIPPYLPDFAFGEPLNIWFEKARNFTLENYRWIAGDSLYLQSFLTSLRVAAISTALTLVIGFPMALAIARTPARWKGLLLVAVILPFWTSFLIRVYSLIGILKREGLLNQFLLWLGVIDDPLTIGGTQIAVYIGIVYTYLPFMVLPLFAVLDKIDGTLLEAAADLGANAFQRFWKIIIPLAMPGIIAGSMLVFIPALGEFVIPDLLGGKNALMLGKTIWQEFFNNRDWPVASAVAILLLLLLVLPIAIFQNAQFRADQRERG